MQQKPRSAIAVSLMFVLGVVAISSMSHAQDGCESLVHEFTDGDNPTYTTNAYSGLVRIQVSGTGQAEASDYSDAFYVYEDTNGNGDPPYVPYYYDFLYNFALWINGGPARDSIGYLPEYEPTHEYVFELQAEGLPLSFAVGDTGTSDNSGSYLIEVCPLGSPAVPDTNMYGLTLLFAGLAVILAGATALLARRRGLV